MIKLDEKTLEKYTKQIEKRLVKIDDCLIWDGSTNKGEVPLFCRSVKGIKTTLYPRRIIYNFYHGEIDMYDCVVPSCGNPRCLNPEHLVTKDRGRVISDSRTKRLSEAEYEYIRSHQGNKFSRGVDSKHATAKLLAKKFGIGVRSVKRLWAKG